MVGVFNSLERHLPPNAGSFRRVEVRLREGCVVGVPHHPPSCSVATTNLGDRVTCATQRAMAEIDPHIGLADAGAVLPPSSGVVSGTDPRTGGDFCNQFLLSVGAGSGTPWVDGWVTIGTMGKAGMAMRDSIEIHELKPPILMHERRLVRDAEGAGAFRGAPAARIEYGPLDCAVSVVYVSDGTINPAKGARGGLDGTPARQFKRAVDGALHPLPVAAQITLEPGETALSYTAGAGGYGPPTARNPAHAAHDVAECWITWGRAYGVTASC